VTLSRRANVRPFSIACKSGLDADVFSLFEAILAHVLFRVAISDIARDCDSIDTATSGADIDFLL
jgi:hypothetical protein